MSKGMSPALVALILGIIAIVVILATAGRPMVQQLQSFFAPGGLASPQEEESGGVSGSEGAGLPTLLISGSKDEMKTKLVNLLLECWKSHDKDEHGCYIVDFDVPGGAQGTRVSREARLINLGEWGQAFTREEITAELQKRQQSDAAAGFDPQSTWQKVRFQSPIALGFVKGGTVTIPRYKICVDEDVGQDELFLADTVAARCE